MFRHLWGIKATLTGEDSEIFSHEQMVLAESMVKLIESTINALAYQSNKMPVSYSIEPVKIIIARMENVSHAIQHSIEATYEIQSLRGGKFTERPATLKKIKSSPVHPFEFPDLPIDDSIKHVIENSLNIMNNLNIFNKLLGVNSTIDAFLPTLKTEMEHFVK